MRPGDSTVLKREGHPVVQGSPHESPPRSIGAVSPSSHTPSDYRADIDGLRAVAVLAVLVYHALPTALPGGFTGVDIFFVISGYLISRIILGDLKKGRFTFADFYSRRIRRIFPALAVVLTFVLVFGWYVLLPAHFRQLGLHAAAGAAFVSNIALFLEAGYFDVDADLKPLLHLWSLGVEEQYYLVWPLMLFAVRRHVHRIFWMIVALAVGSFLLNVIATPRFPEAAFYLPPTRFWELMIGSIVAYAQVYRSATGTVVTASAGGTQWSNSLSVTGAALLVAAMILVNDNRSFPGWWALLPTVGTLLLIVGGPGAWINRHILSNRVAVFVGLISYPLYLWHWPLLSYARILNGGAEPPVGVRLGAAAASILLAWLTYRMIETKLRHSRRASWSHVIVPALVTSMAALAVYGVLVSSSISQARSAAVPHLAAVSEAFDDWEYGGDGVYPGDTRRTVLFFGDSHMAQYLPRIEKLIDEHQRPMRTVIFSTAFGCAPMPGIERKARKCAKFVAETLAAARREEVDTIVISASWRGLIDRTDYYKVGDPPDETLDLNSPAARWVMDGFEAALRELTRAGKRVVIVLTGPYGRAFDPGSMVVRDGFDFGLSLSPAVPRSRVAEMNAHVDDPLRAMAARIGATVIDPSDTWCTATECPTTDAAGNPLYKDSSHLRTSVVRRRFDALDHLVYADTSAGGGQ